MKDKKVIRVSKKAKINLWLYKEKHGFNSLAEALDDYIQRTKKSQKNRRLI